MKYTIKLKADWPVNNGFISKGRYQVPDQISEKMAHKAIREGYADKSLPTLTLKGKKPSKKRRSKK